MTMDEIKKSKQDMLTAVDVAEVIGVDAHNLRLQAKKDPAKLGFPVIVIGTRIRIPRAGFVNFVQGRYNNDDGHHNTAGQRAESKGRMGAQTPGM